MSDEVKYLKYLKNGDNITRLEAFVSEVRAPVGKGPLKLILKDKSGIVSAKKWQGDPADYKVGEFISFSGQVEEYPSGSGNIDINIQDVQHLETPEDLSDYMPTAPIPLNQLIEQLDELIETIKQPQLNTLINYLIGKTGVYRKGFEEAPAAKGRHHACRHGLLWHSLEVAYFVDADAVVYSKMYGRPLFRDLMVAAALLHDIGKIEEISRDGIVYKITRSGSTQGHIGRGLIRVNDAIRMVRKELKVNGKTFDEELERQILHVVVSHHGRSEYGALTEPENPEASLINLADQKSCEKYYFLEVEESNVGDETTYNSKLPGSSGRDGRYVWTGMLKFMQRLGVIDAE